MSYFFYVFPYVRVKTQFFNLRTPTYSINEFGKTISDSTSTDA